MCLSVYLEAYKKKRALGDGIIAQFYTDSVHHVLRETDTAESLGFVERSDVVIWVRLLSKSNSKAAR